FVDRAGRKSQRVLHAKANRLGPRNGVVPDRAAAAVEVLQEAHGLEEVEVEPLGEEPRRHRRLGALHRLDPHHFRRRLTGRYSRDCAPALGGHRLKYPSLCLPFATSWLKELTEV